MSTWTEPEALYEQSKKLLYLKCYKVDFWSIFFSNYMKGLNSVVLAIFQKGLAWPCPVITGPQKGQSCGQKLEKTKKTNLYTHQ